MKLFERYIDGETKEVYQDIYNLGADAFLPANFIDVDKVFRETFHRVAYNLQIIYDELKRINYQFKPKPNYNFEKPFHKPLSNTLELLNKLEQAVHDFGYVPLSLQYFYKIVGGVNFVWDFETDENFLWEMSDPIQVASLDSVVEEVTQDDWKEEMLYSIENNDIGVASLALSADDLHKDNVSGGAQYAIEITKERSIDARFLNEPNNTTFIDYLRKVFEHCGFMGNPEEESFKEFCKIVKPKLKQI